MKRLFDLMLCVLILAPAAVFVAVMAVWIRLDSTGPALFRQSRVGRNGVPFTCLKLRTMYAGTPTAPTHQAPANSVTRIGGFLRASKLDELPQLWNIIRGEMSFVGPRPCLTTQTELIDARKRLGVIALLPGISGVAQVKGIDMSNPQRLAETDAVYLENMSVLEDIKILALTLAGFGGGDRTRG